jgi:aminoglycoside N3'-acetyltransferase
MKELTRSEVASQLRSLGVHAGGVLLVHASFRAVRPVEGGPLGLIEALRESLGPQGTLVMPSWPGDDHQPFHHQQTASAADLGIVADTFWRQPGVLRCEHLQAFAAVGPKAVEITRDPLPLPPHIPASPVGRVYDLDGHVLLLGVEHKANTILHLAELLAGVPYGVAKCCTVYENGRPTRLNYRENDHCCERFDLADTWLRERGLQSEGVVGHAVAKLTRSRDVVETAVAYLAHDPLLFLHPPGSGCSECDEAHAGVNRTNG